MEGKRPVIIISCVILSLFDWLRIRNKFDNVQKNEKLKRFSWKTLYIYHRALARVQILKLAGGYSMCNY